MARYSFLYFQIQNSQTCLCIRFPQKNTKCHQSISIKGKTEPLGCYPALWEAENLRRWAECQFRQNFWKFIFFSLPCCPVGLWDVGKAVVWSQTAPLDVGELVPSCGWRNAFLFLSLSSCEREWQAWPQWWDILSLHPALKASGLLKF